MALADDDDDDDDVDARLQSEHPVLGPKVLDRSQLPPVDRVVER